MNKNMIPKVVVLNAIRMVTKSNINKPISKRNYLLKKKKNSNINVHSDGTKATYNNTFSIKKKHILPPHWVGISFLPGYLFSNAPIDWNFNFLKGKSQINIIVIVIVIIVEN
jgi:hypothetical protein